MAKALFPMDEILRLNMPEIYFCRSAMSIKAKAAKIDAADAG
jgi:hypothetical protein